MFKILLFLSAMGSTSREPPSFQSGRQLQLVSDSFNPDVKFESQTIEFHKHFPVTIADSTFSGLQTTARPNGGALRMSLTHLMIPVRELIGGAMYAINSVLTCRKVEFIGCRANYLAGSGCLRSLISTQSSCRRQFSVTATRYRSRGR
jgi:hypothetical protein